MLARTLQLPVNSMSTQEKHCITEKVRRGDWKHWFIFFWIPTIGMGTHGKSQKQMLLVGNMYNSIYM